MEKNKKIYNKWKQFIVDYREYFKSKDEIWNETLSELKIYIAEYKKIPPKHNKDPTIKHLNKWIINQQNN